MIFLLTVVLFSLIMNGGISALSASSKLLCDKVPPHYSWEKAVITQLLQGGGPPPPLQLDDDSSSPPCLAASCTSQQQPKKGEGGNNFTTFLWTLNLESINKKIKNPDRFQFKHSL